MVIIVTGWWLKPYDTFDHTPICSHFQVQTVMIVWRDEPTKTSKVKHSVAILLKPKQAAEVAHMNRVTHVRFFV